jgi:hypothetical protein
MPGLSLKKQAAAPAWMSVPAFWPMAVATSMFNDGADWKSATDDMKDLEVDNYLADLIVAIDDLGGRVNRTLKDHWPDIASWLAAQ